MSFQSVNAHPDCTQTGFYHCHLILIPQCSNRTRSTSPNPKAAGKHKTNSPWGPLLNSVSQTRYPGARHHTAATPRLPHAGKSLHPSWDKPDTARRGSQHPGSCTTHLQPGGACLQLPQLHRLQTPTQSLRQGRGKIPLKLGLVPA